MNRRKSPVKSQQTVKHSSFRIIAGQWRGRKLNFPTTPGLRPTPDRIRETLFNWLSGELANKACIDLFCGSGALGLESLSRGAAYCTFIDSERLAVDMIKQHLTKLPEAKGEAICAQLPDAIRYITHPVDIVFLDPPYAIDAIQPCIDNLLEKSLLNDKAWVYVECSSSKHLPIFPESLTLIRNKSNGQVQYALYQYTQLAS